jgi:hypothetical protein
MHQQRHVLNIRSQEEREAIRLFRALLGNPSERQSAMDSIVERGGSRANQLAIARLSALLVLTHLDINEPDHPVLSRDENDFLALLSRAQLDQGERHLLGAGAFTNNHMQTALQAELAAGANALMMIGIRIEPPGDIIAER